MRLSFQLATVLVVAAVLPLLVGGWLLIRVTRTALEDQVRAGQVAAAEGIAESAGRWVTEVIDRLELSADVFELAGLDPEARVGALRILYRQLEDVDVVALVDGAGRPVVEPVRLGDGQARPPHLPVNDEELAAFHGRIPVAEALAEGTAVGPAYAAPRKHAVMVPVAVRIAGPDDAPWVLAVELSLRSLQRRVGRAAGREVGTPYVVDERGRLLAHPDGARLLEPAPVMPGDRGPVRRLAGAEGPLLAAAVPFVGRSWTAVVVQPEARAFAPVRDMTGRTAGVLGVAAAVALGLGLLLAGQIVRPLGRAAAGARAIAAGDLGQRLSAGGPREVRELAAAFDAMSVELRRSRSEVERFNARLQGQVAERTAELRRAQAQLLQSRNLAAVGELGAGVAHELNNPLTAILGLTQLLLRKHPDGDPDHRHLRGIESGARRCRDVTANLLRFSEQKEAPELDEVDLNEVVGRAVDLKRTVVAQAELVLSLQLAEALPPVRADAAQIQQVVLHLLANSVTACDPGGTITVETAGDEAFVQLIVRDTGRGIPPENLGRIFEPFFTTKKDWRGAGLGLSVSYRIAQAHHGTLTVESRLGQGTVATLGLPRPRASSSAA